MLVYAPLCVHVLFARVHHMMWPQWSLSLSLFCLWGFNASETLERAKKKKEKNQSNSPFWTRSGISCCFLSLLWEKPVASFSFCNHSSSNEHLFMRSYICFQTNCWLINMQQWQLGERSNRRSRSGPDADWCSSDSLLSTFQSLGSTKMSC